MRKPAHFVPNRQMPLLLQGGGRIGAQGPVDVAEVQPEQVKVVDPVLRRQGSQSYPESVSSLYAPCGYMAATSRAGLPFDRLSTPKRGKKAGTRAL